MEKNFIAEIKKEIEKKMEVDLLVGIDYESIRLHNTHELVVTNATESENIFELETEECFTFTIGKNYKEFFYNEIENEYMFAYENGVVVTVFIQ